MLNKILRYTKDGLELEADPRHAELVIRELGLGSCKPSRVPGSKVDSVRRRDVEEEALAEAPLDDLEVEAGQEDTIRQSLILRKSGGRVVAIEEAKSPEEADWNLMAVDTEPIEGEEELGLGDAKKYRSVTARHNYIAPDRVDIQYATKETARHMAKPRRCDMGLLRRIGKYLVGRPRLVMHFRWQSSPCIATVYNDSDWAGCPTSAKSTSGGIVSLGSHVLKTWSRQQRTVALSSAEAELHAAVATSAEVLGVISLCRDLGAEVGGEVNVDSSAALGIAQRAGYGKVRHLRIHSLWVQEVRSTGRLSYKKVLGTLNPSDVLTKHVPGDLLDAHLRTLGLEIRGGRAESAPSLDSLVVERIKLEDRAGQSGRRNFAHADAGGAKPAWVDMEDSDVCLDSLCKEDYSHD